MVDVPVKCFNTCSKVMSRCCCLFEYTDTTATARWGFSFRDDRVISLKEQRLKFKIFPYTKMASTTWNHICALHRCDGASMNQMNRRTAA